MRKGNHRLVHLVVDSDERLLTAEPVESLAPMKTCIL